MSDAPQEKLLIIRPSALGDVARTVPCLVRLRQAFAQAQIDWLVNQAFLPAIEAHPALNHAIGYDRKGGLKAMWQTARQLRDHGYTRVYDLQGLARSGFWTRFSAAPIRVGDAKAREMAPWAYTHKVHLTHTHTVDRMLGLVAPVCETAPNQAVNSAQSQLAPDMRLYVPKSGQDWANTFFEQHGLTAGRYVCMAPTAQWGCKCWPIEHYRQLAARLLEQKNKLDIDGPVLVLAAAHEKAHIAPLLETLGTQAIWPQTDVGQLMALIQNAALVVCNDSAAAHIAVGFDRPMACVFGPTNPKQVGPYLRPETVVQPEHITEQEMTRYRAQKDDDSLIARVRVNQVWDVLMRQLG